jgi:hypothetical protein
MQFFRTCLRHNSKRIMTGFCLNHWSLIPGYYLEFGAWYLRFLRHYDAWNLVITWTLIIPCWILSVHFLLKQGFDIVQIHRRNILNDEIGPA